MRSRSNQMQAKLFSEQLQEVLARYEARQITSGEVIERLVELAKKMRDARRRNEALGLTRRGGRLLRRARRRLGGLDGRPEAGRDRARARQGDQGGPDRRLGRSRGDRGRDPGEDQAAAAAARLQAAAAAGAGGMPDSVVDDILEQARVLYRYGRRRSASCWRESRSRGPACWERVGKSTRRVKHS